MSTDQAEQAGESAEDVATSSEEQVSDATLGGSAGTVTPDSRKVPIVSITDASAALGASVDDGSSEPVAEPVADQEAVLGGSGSANTDSRKVPVASTPSATTTAPGGGSAGTDSRKVPI
jgi:hypothetical protein